MLCGVYFTSHNQLQQSTEPPLMIMTIQDCFSKYGCLILTCGGVIVLALEKWIGQPVVPCAHTVAALQRMTGKN
jgi:hypothetical protein